MLNKCEDCILVKQFGEENVGYADFEIVGEKSKVKVVFVGEAPGMEEIKAGLPFVGRAGSFLRDELRDIVKDYALVNAMKCQPKSGIRTPTEEEIKYCAKHCKEYIISLRPNIVIALGSSAAKAVLPESYHKGQSITKLSTRAPVEIDGIKYAATFHPSYLIRSGGKNHSQYKDWISRIKKLLGFEQQDSEVALKIEITNLDDLPRVLTEYWADDDLAMDYEGTSLDTFAEDFDILGLSISNFEKATYIEFHRPLTEMDRVLFTSFLKAKKPWVYNVNYEAKVTWAKITNSLIHFNDTYMLCKLECSPGRLKDNARKLVNADYWEDAITGIKEPFERIFSSMTRFSDEIRKLKLKLENEINPKEVLKITSQLNSFELAFNALKAGNYKLVADQCFNDKDLAKKYAPIMTEIAELNGLIDENDIVRGLTKYPKEWAAVPVAITGEYCCYDSYYTLLVKRKLWDKHKDYYHYYITQGWVGAAMESYGLNWNDEVASNHEKYYLEESIDCLYNLINMLDFGDSVDYINDKGKEIHEKGTDELRLDAKKIFESNAPLNDKLLDLKEIFNPLSNLARTQEPFWKVYKSNFVTAISIFFYLEEEILKSSIIPDDAMKLFDRTDLNKTISSLVNNDWTQLGKDIAASKNIQKAVNKLISTLNVKIQGVFGRFASEVIEWQFQAHKRYGNLDVDKRETWTDEFRMLYYLRRFKKVNKSRSTYINGKVGRGKVWLSKVTEANKPPIRIAPYFEVMSRNPYYKLKPNERWILDTEYGICTANTLRWKSPIHVIPWSSELREIYEARDIDTLLMHYDNAQSEVRVLAKMSGDQALYEAFESGYDIHRFIASKIWRRKPEEVTDAQRRYSKMATFSILFRKGVESFAAEHMQGDVAAAQKLFDDFFAAFPGIKNMIDESDIEVLAKGTSTTMFGNKILVDMNDVNEAKRNAFNWRIQSSSSVLTGYSIWENYSRSIDKLLTILPLVFTHDSHDMEFATKDMFEIIDNVHECAVGIAVNDWNVPMEIDFEIGDNQANTMELEEKHRDFTSRVYHFACLKEAIDPIIVKLKRHFDVKCEIDHTKTKESYASLEEMFVPRRAFSKYLGCTVTKVEGTLELVKRKYENN